MIRAPAAIQKPLPSNGPEIAQRSQRPNLLSRRASSKVKTKATVPKAKAEDKADMTTGFLQYCATCEKQISVPDSSILYCSEACRRKDSAKPLSLATDPMCHDNSKLPPSPKHHRSILAPLTPTTYSPSPTPVIRIPAELHDHQSDLDPTEWKPKSRRHPPTNSEAWRYLSQFHRNAKNTESRPPYHRSSSSLSNMIPPAAPTPSLTHTPSTAASSLDSDWSMRPLPPRHTSFASASAGIMGGVDLVTPFAPPPAENVTRSMPAVDLMGAIWEKKVVPTKEIASDNGELGVLFGSGDKH